jgi:hypothetical protein
VIRADTDGQPIPNIHFTTLANTHPVFLIVGNMAKQGYGYNDLYYDFCMQLHKLHLFTGLSPYKLQRKSFKEVVGPENLNKKLNAIWRGKSLMLSQHDVGLY